MTHSEYRGRKEDARLRMLLCEHDFQVRPMFDDDGKIVPGTDSPSCVKCSRGVLEIDPDAAVFAKEAAAAGASPLSLIGE